MSQRDRTEEVVEAMARAMEEAAGETVECERCKGRGYHHGFGEHGRDPDWCIECGGAGFLPRNDERAAWLRAVDALPSDIRAAIRGDQS